MSAAELHRNQEKIVFVWGGCCDVPAGLVRTLHYHANKVPQNYMNQTIEKDAARKYWERLVLLGFHQTGNPLLGICSADLLIRHECRTK